MKETRVRRRGNEERKGKARGRRSEKQREGDLFNDSRAEFRVAKILRTKHISVADEQATYRNHEPEAPARTYSESRVFSS